MNISELKESKYLKKEDCVPPITVTITGVSSENLAKDGEPEQNKFILKFKETKPMVLNSTNGQLIALVTGSEETDDWIGKQIVLYNDPTVSFAGQLTGGIRVQVQPTQPVSEVNPPPMTEQDVFDSGGDSVPF